MTQINGYKSQIAQFESTITSLRQQIQGFQGGNNAEINGLKQQINIYITQINSYKTQLTQAQNQNTNLRQQLQAFQGNQGAITG